MNIDECNRGYWDSKSEGGACPIEAIVIKCAKEGNTLHILFRGHEIHDDGDRVPCEARVSFDISKDIQVTEGKLVITDTQKESPRFSSSEEESRYDEYQSKVEGYLKIEGKQVEFNGMWDDTALGRENSCVYDFYFTSIVEEV